jgi:hypothetical protein
MQQLEPTVCRTKTAEERESAERQALRLMLQLLQDRQRCLEQAEDVSLLRVLYLHASYTPYLHASYTPLTYEQAEEVTLLRVLS